MDTAQNNTASDFQTAAAKRAASREKRLAKMALTDPRHAALCTELSRDYGELGLSGIHHARLAALRSAGITARVRG